MANLANKKSPDIFAQNYLISYAVHFGIIFLVFKALW